MTKLLLRLFVKDAQNPDSPAVRLAVGKLAGVVGILCNALLCLGKVLAGVFSGSVALVADGVNNLSDAASSVVTLLGFRMAQQPADADHPYGHARYEYISGLVVAALILVIGADLAQSSVGKILHPQPVDTSPVVFGVLVVAILGKCQDKRPPGSREARRHCVTVSGSFGLPANEMPKHPKGRQQHRRAKQHRLLPPPGAEGCAAQCAKAKHPNYSPIAKCGKPFAPVPLFQRQKGMLTGAAQIAGAESGSIRHAVCFSKAIKLKRTHK